MVLFTGKLKKVLLFVSVACVAAVSLFLLDITTNVFSHRADYEMEQDTVRQVELKFPEPEVFYGMIINGHHVVENEVKRNQRFTDLFKDYHVGDKIYRQLSLLPKAVFDFRKVATHKKYTLVYKDDSL